MVDAYQRGSNPQPPAAQSQTTQKVKLKASGVGNELVIDRSAGKDVGDEVPKPTGPNGLNVGNEIPPTTSKPTTTTTTSKPTTARPEEQPNFHPFDVVAEETMPKPPEKEEEPEKEEPPPVKIGDEMGKDDGDGAGGKAQGAGGGRKGAAAADAIDEEYADVADTADALDAEVGSLKKKQCQSPLSVRSNLMIKFVFL